MKIQALQALTLRDATTGALTSIACGGIADVSDDLGETLILDGLAEEYTLITPTGSISITENGTSDVTQYASAAVNVPQPSGSVSITSNGTVDVTSYASAVINVPVVTLSYNSNGGTGTINDVPISAGSSVELNNGASLTPPEGKTFSGWATTSSATEPDAVSPYKVTSDKTLYAVWTDAT